MKSHLMIVFSLSIAVGLLTVIPGWSQAPPPAQPKAVEPPRYEAVQFYTPGPGAGPQTVYTVPGFAAPNSATAELNNIVKQLRETEDEAKKAELTKQLEAAVSKHFDEDMKARESELTKLEERLTKLRSQLDRRRKAKAEITQLQTKVLANEAEGLGFSGVSGIDGLKGVGGFYNYGTGYPGAAPAVAPAPVAVPPRR